MYIRPLKKEEVIAIHARYMREAFPPAELRPASDMARLMRRGRYVCCGLFDGGRLAAYAFFYRHDARLLLLDYLAVVPGRRGSGIGSAFLRALDTALQGACVLGEVEAPDGSGSAENALRRRRIAFYERAGFRCTAARVTLFGVRYAIIARHLPAHTSTGALYVLLRRLYRGLMPPYWRALGLRLH